MIGDGKKQALMGQVVQDIEMYDLKQMEIKNGDQRFLRGRTNGRIFKTFPSEKL